ncbi:hypothetical protein [Methanoculleus chikugoensis]|uniref:hypothetical protein n=1 Tax=Methanoculleus chikugoensis TaxID=118126 RepID=UPI001FB42C2B|nr:hypothetical protein [Methanoculleus chikugoensis]
MICDQVEDPKTAKGVVKREVTRVITPPGTLIDSSMLGSAGAHYLMAVAPPDRKDAFGLAFLDVSTGEFFVSSGGSGGRDYAEIVSEVVRHRPLRGNSSRKPRRRASRPARSPRGGDGEPLPRRRLRY